MILKERFLENRIDENLMNVITSRENGIHLDNDGVRVTTSDKKGMISQRVSRE